MFERLGFHEVWHGIRFSILIGCVLMVAGTLGAIYVWTHPPISTLRSDIKMTWNDINGFINTRSLIISVEVGGQTERFIAWVYNGFTMPVEINATYGNITNNIN